ncbi:MAG TPA: hypothetical protein VG675_07785 [Bryobacteraceae bacterium]|nr:hypothetical protein [Bryobacteraceae bacterium]
MLWALTSAAAIASAQHAGDNPPALVWNSLKGSCPKNLDWANLRGKVVVVSFSPNDVFPSDIDNWKKAVKPFDDEQVQFIRIVGGSEFLLEQALWQSDYHGCVLFDANLQNQRNFKLSLSRRVVVIAPSGTILGYARGGDDIRDTVQSALNNRPGMGLEETPPRPQSSDPNYWPQHNLLRHSHFIGISRGIAVTWTSRWGTLHFQESAAETDHSGSLGHATHSDRIPGNVGSRKL